MKKKKTITDWEAKGFTMKDGKLVPSKKKSYNKYRNTKVEVDGIKFDSKKESQYYGTLKMLKKKGEVVDFQMQVPFPIEVNGIHIAKYLLDFKVEYKNRVEYIDVKAKSKDGKWITTDVFRLKKKLIEAIYGIEIKMV